MSESPIPGFLRAFRDRRHQALQPFLHDEIVYSVAGFEPVIGRPRVMAYWRRIFEVYQAVRMSFDRHVRDGDLVIASQRQLYLAERREPLILDSLVVYELQGETIRTWSDALSASDMAEQEVALWRRLRDARW